MVSPPIQLCIPCRQQGIFQLFNRFSLSVIVLYHRRLPMSSTFLKKVLFAALGIFLWIPEPPLELADRLSLSTRLSYYCHSRLSILFLKIFLFTRLQKPANPHKHWENCMKKSFFVKNYFLLKRKIKVVRIRQIAYRV